MQTGIIESLNAVRKLMIKPLIITKTYYGKAYKHDSPEGIIGYRLNSKFIGNLNIADETNYFLLHRRTFWRGWLEHCGLSYNSKYADGLTISYEIFIDMKEDKTLNPRLLVTNNDILYVFNVQDVVKFVDSYKTKVINQNHGFVEVGIPISIHSHNQSLIKF